MTYFCQFLFFWHISVILFETSPLNPVSCFLKNKHFRYNERIGFLRLQHLQPFFTASSLRTSRISANIGSSYNAALRNNYSYDHETLFINQNVYMWVGSIHILTNNDKFTALYCRTSEGYMFVPKYEKHFTACYVSFREVPSLYFRGCIASLRVRGREKYCYYGPYMTP